MIPRERIDRARKADRVRPPQVVPRMEVPNERLASMSVNADFGLAVVPAPAPEYPDVVGERLLEIQVVALFGLRAVRT